MIQPNKKLALGEGKCKFDTIEMYLQKINQIPNYTQQQQK